MVLRISAIRAAICELVQQDPGIHFRQIQRSLDLSPGQTAHHLRKLVREGLLTERRLAGHAHYFPAGAAAPGRAAHAAVRHPARLAVARALLDEGARTLRELSERTGYAPSTLHHHLRILGDAGGLVREGERPARYIPTDVLHSALARPAAA
jgi:DNA-binding transcriptional ArsR family regulator